MRVSCPIRSQEPVVALVFFVEHFAELGQRLEAQVGWSRLSYPELGLDPVQSRCGLRVQRSFALGDLPNFRP